MILFVRKYFHKRVMQGLIIVMVLSLIGIGSFSQIITLFFNDSTYAFTVNGQGVTHQMFALRAAGEKKILEFYTAQLGELAPRFLMQAGIDMSPEKNAYKKIVEDLVISSLVERSGLSLSTRAVAQKAQDPMTMMNIFGSALPRALYDRNGRIQEDILLRILSVSGLTMHDFEKLVEQAVERDLALDLFRLATPVMQKEIDMYALKECGTRDFTLITYSLESYLKQARAMGAPDAELEKFFAERNAQSHAYWSPEKRSGILWKIPTTEKNKEKITQAAQEAIKVDEKEGKFDRFIQEYKAKKTVVNDVEDMSNPMLFTLAVNNKGLYHKDNELIIVMPTAIVPQEEKSYQSVKKQVEDDYYLQQAQKELVADLEGAGVSDEYITSTQKFTLKGADGQAEIEKLTKNSFSGDRIKNMVIEGQRLRGLRDKKGGYVVTLDQVTPAEKVTSEQYATARRELLKENERLVTAASVDSLLKNAKINNNNR